MKLCDIIKESHSFFKIVYSYSVSVTLIKTLTIIPQLFSIYLTTSTLLRCGNLYMVFFGHVSLSMSKLTKGHFTHETESPWPLHFKHSCWWKMWSRSKFTSHYAWGTNGICECKMDAKSTWLPKWHRMGHVSWSLGLFSKTTSRR